MHHISTYESHNQQQTAGKLPPKTYYTNRYTFSHFHWIKEQKHTLPVRILKCDTISRADRKLAERSFILVHSEEQNQCAGVGFLDELTYEKRFIYGFLWISQVFFYMVLRISYSMKHRSPKWIQSTR